MAIHATESRGLKGTAVYLTDRSPGDQQVIRSGSGNQRLIHAGHETVGDRIGQLGQSREVAGVPVLLGVEGSEVHGLVAGRARVAHCSYTGCPKTSAVKKRTDLRWSRLRVS